MLLLLYQMSAPDPGSDSDDDNERHKAPAGPRAPPEMKIPHDDSFPWHPEQEARQDNVVRMENNRYVLPEPEDDPEGVNVLEPHAADGRPPEVKIREILRVLGQRPLFRGVVLDAIPIIDSTHRLMNVCTAEGVSYQELRVLGRVAYDWFMEHSLMGQYLFMIWASFVAWSQQEIEANGQRHRLSPARHRSFRWIFYAFATLQFRHVFTGVFAFIERIEARVAGYNTLLEAALEEARAMPGADRVRPIPVRVSDDEEVYRLAQMHGDGLDDSDEFQMDLIQGGLMDDEEEALLQLVPAQRRRVQVYADTIAQALRLVPVEEIGVVVDAVMSDATFHGRLHLRAHISLANRIAEDLGMRRRPYVTDANVGGMRVVKDHFSRLIALIDRINRVRQELIDNVNQAVARRRRV